VVIVRKYVIPEIFFKSIAEKGKLYSRVWFYWLSGFVDELFEPDFIEKQEKEFKISEIKEIYHFGIRFLQQDFKIIENKKEKAIGNKEHKDIAIQIIEYLNSQAETTFSTKIGSNIELICARLKDGYTLSDFKSVIDKKVKDWKGTDWAKFLRPNTLFAKTKIENYLNSNNNDKQSTNKFSKFADSVAKAKTIIGVHHN
jgi:uncharacterized phage protein (TIGR02220 family)